MDAKPPIRFRKLRIAWSVGWGIVCVLLIVLWVRSYSYRGNIQLLIANRMYQCSLFPGRMHFRTALRERDHLAGIWQWHKSDVHFGNWDWPNSPTFYLKFNENIPGRTSIHFPYWFPLLACTAAAVVPWLRWLSWQFSLRTLLIATTLVAVILGIIAVSN